MGKNILLNEGRVLLSVHQVQYIGAMLFLVIVMMIYLLAIYFINSHQRHKKKEFKSYMTHRFEEEGPYYMYQEYLMQEQEGN